MAELQSEDSNKTPVNATVACKNRRGKFITSKKWKTNSEKLSVMKKCREMYKAKRKLTYENGEDSSGQSATTSDTLSEPQNKRRKRDQKVNMQVRVCYYHL